MCVFWFVAIKPNRNEINSCYFTNLDETQNYIILIIRFFRWQLYHLQFLCIRLVFCSGFQLLELECLLGQSILCCYAAIMLLGLVHNWNKTIFLSESYFCLKFLKNVCFVKEFLPYVRFFKLWISQARWDKCGLRMGLVARGAYSLWKPHKRKKYLCWTNFALICVQKIRKKSCL